MNSKTYMTSPVTITENFYIPTDSELACEDHLYQGLKS